MSAHQLSLYNFDTQAYERVARYALENPQQVQAIVPVTVFRDEFQVLSTQSLRIEKCNADCPGYVIWFVQIYHSFHNTTKDATVQYARSQVFN